MAERGFVYLPVTYSDSADAEWARASNPLNSASAAVYGYVVPRFDNVRNDNGSTDADFNAALNGAGDDITTGCAWRSFARFEAEYNAYFDKTTTLIYGIYEVADGFASSNEARIVQEAWSRCMAGHGYDFATPGAAAQSFESDDERPSEREIEVRMADLRCDEETKLTMTRSVWERARVEAYLDEQALAVSEAKKAEENLVDAIERASAVEPTFP